VLAEEEHRPARLFTLDTGAAPSIADQRWVALGPPLEGGSQGSVGGVGGRRATTRYRSELAFRTRGLDFSLPALVVPQLDDRPDSPFHAWGTLGADFWTGRTLLLDPAARRIQLGERPAHDGWRPGQELRMVLEGPERPSVTMSQRVVEVTDQGLLIDLVVDPGEGRQLRRRFRVPLQQDLADHWLQDLPIEAAWRRRSERCRKPLGLPELRAEPAQLTDDWLGLSLAQAAGATEVAIVEDAAGPRPCRRSSGTGWTDGRAEDSAVTWCDGDGWTLWSMELTDPRTGELRWRLRRE